MEKYKSGVPPFDPQLHLFEDVKLVPVETLKKEDQVGDAIVLPVEISHDEMKTSQEIIDDKKAKLIEKYKLGPEAIENLTYKKEEFRNDDETAGWYVKNDTLKSWYEQGLRLDSDEGNYEYSWQRIHNK
jgi:hypothetical protein